MYSGYGYIVASSQSYIPQFGRRQLISFVTWKNLNLFCFIKTRGSNCCWTDNVVQPQPMIRKSSASLQTIDHVQALKKLFLATGQLFPNLGLLVSSISFSCLLGFNS
jgi:hypothetical protein